ncbi:MAG: heat-inducible transcriptional repressor HrcA [Clostridiaceae bacterium]|nr:heat-inducible transcriptional repressor HrcA [Clostridiaceae bacterium]
MLPNRKQLILKTIIESYISSAEPVGSKTLLGSFDKPLSSATIRNEMSELEEMGLLEKQHVSSGRVPSNTAYRLYVDHLMDQYRMASLELESMRKEMENKMRDMDSLLLAASRVVSKLTDHTSVALSTKNLGEDVRKIELIPMDSAGMLYALVLICEKSVRNRVIKLSSPVPSDNIHALTGFINMAIAEGRLDRLNTVIAQSFGENSPFAVLAQEVLGFINESRCERFNVELYLEGASKLLQNREYHDVRKAGELLDHMADPGSVRELVQNALPGKINIRIGPENEDPALSEASFVFTTYSFDQNSRGIIGIVAPTRMDYAKAKAQLAAFVSMLNDIQHKKEKGIGERNEP